MHNVTRQSSESETIEKILLIRVFDLSVTHVVWRKSGIKKYDTVL